MKDNASTRTLIGIVVVAVLAIGFWILLLSPKREEASELSTEVEGLQATLAQSQQTLADAEAARREFPKNYKKLVVLGQAVPAGDETASLLVELNRIADEAHVDFKSITLGTADGGEAGEEGATTTTTEGTSTAATPTEAEAALMPIGASVGSAGLGVMPYDLEFTGSFFHVADFIKGIDSLLQTKGSKLTVDGRLVTLNGFSLGPAKDGFPELTANFSVTTFLVPPSQGVTAGATPEGPGEVPAEGTEAAAPEEGATQPVEEEETTEGVPSSATEEAR